MKTKKKKKRTEKHPPSDPSAKICACFILRSSFDAGCLHLRTLYTLVWSPQILRKIRSIIMIIFHSNSTL